MIVKGNLIRDKIRSIVRDKCNREDYYLNIIRLGSNPSDLSYERGIIKACESVGMSYKVHNLKEDSREEDIISLIERLNRDGDVDGIIVFRPLPLGLDEDRIINTIDPNKDVDGSTDVNLGKIFTFKEGLKPATALACQYFLKDLNIEIEGKNILIINRSTVLGRPLSMLLLKDNGTVTISHSRTRNLLDLIGDSDIIISAIGRGHFFKEDIFGKDQVLIDVGMDEDEDGNLMGDFDTEFFKDKVDIITPVIGGIGSITSSLLLLNTTYAKELKGKENGR